MRMKRDYSKWCSVALIAAIYTLAGVAGWLLFEGEYRAIREQIETDPTLTAVVRSRQLHVYRDGKKILVLAGKSMPKIILEDKLSQLIL